MNLEVIVLAAGQGTRMKSRIPKVLHQVGGQPMLKRVLNTAQSLSPAHIHVVVGLDREEIEAEFLDVGIDWVVQEQQLGTGHAVLQALPAIGQDSDVLVVYGDCPLVSDATLLHCATAAADGISLVTADVPDPTGLGRIIRDDSNQVEAIVEQLDVTPEQCEIREINSGILCASVELLRRYLPEIGDDNAQSEIYLTDLIAIAQGHGTPVNAVLAQDYREVLGVNDRVQQAQAERIFQRKQAEQLMKAGISMADPDRFDCRGSVQAGQDCSIDINVLLEGSIDLGDNVQIGPNCDQR